MTSIPVTMRYLNHGTLTETMIKSVGEDESGCRKQTSWGLTRGCARTTQGGESGPLDYK